MATDNAVSALGNLLEAHRDSLGGADRVGQAWELWLGYMPLKADEEEAEKVGGWVDVVTGHLVGSGSGTLRYFPVQYLNSLAWKRYP